MKRSAGVSRKASQNGSTVYFAVDASWDKHNLYVVLQDGPIEREFVSRTDVVEQELTVVRDRALRQGFTDLVLLCEPSGGCEQIVLKTARRLGFRTAWANAEAVSKLRLVESNDTGKTDLKDPRVIHLLAELGKAQKHRMLEVPYSPLRQWHKIYTEAEAGVVAAKSAIHNHRLQLFPDFSFKKDFLFGKSGWAVLEKFGFNPYRIIAAGRRRFERVMRKAAPRIRKDSIERLWNDAQLSVRHGVDSRLLAVQEKYLTQLFEDLKLHSERKAEAARHMEKLYREAQQLDPKLPDAERGVVTTLNLARLIATTGPLSDFQTARQLVRFLGLNLRERQSGHYRGKTRLTKKGSAIGRLVVSQSVLPLVCRKRLFGPVYHAKRKQGMPGNKAMVAMMRRYVKMIFGLYRSGKKFDRSRVFLPESQYQIAA